MTTVSMLELQSDLLAILRRVEAGESFLVVDGEHTIAEVRPAAASRLRPFGLCAGQFVVPPDFDRPLPDDVLAEFEGT